MPPDDAPRAIAGRSLRPARAGKGTVQRKVDGKGILELCGILPKLMGMDGLSFEFAEIDEKWAAVFDAQASE